MRPSSWVTPSLAKIHATLTEKSRSRSVGKSSTYNSIGKILQDEQAGRAWKSLIKQIRKGKIRELITSADKNELLEPQNDFSDLMFFVLDWRKATVYITPDGHFPAVNDTINSFVEDEELMAYALIWMSIERANRSFLTTVKLTKKERQKQLEEALNQLKFSSSTLKYLRSRSLTLLDILKSIKANETDRTKLQAIGDSLGASETLHNLLEKSKLSAVEKSEINKALDKIESSERELASVLVADFFDEILIPYIEDLFDIYEKIPALARPRNKNNFRNILAYSFILTFGEFLETPLKTVASKFISAIFDDPEFDKKKLEQAIKPLQMMKPPYKD